MSIAVAAKARWPLLGARVSRRASIACLAALLICSPVQAIVSERHLKGVRTLDCDLEAGGGAPALTFQLRVDTRKRTLQMADGARQFPYREASDASLQFELVIAQGPPLTCELELPAGALSCAAQGQGVTPRLGLCLRG